MMVHEEEYSLDVCEDIPAIRWKNRMVVVFTRVGERTYDTALKRAQRIHELLKLFHGVEDPAQRMAELLRIEEESKCRSLA